jgi:thioredoxin-like negative regulator of GroEL
MNAFAAVFVVVSIALPAQVAQRSVVPTDYATAYHKAQTGNTPMVVLVTAEWCAPCQQMKRTTLKQMLANNGFKHFLFAMVDVDKEPSLAAKLTEGRPIPQFIVFERSGNSWSRRYSIGYHTVDQLQAFLSPSQPSAARLAGVQPLDASR